MGGTANNWLSDFRNASFYRIQDRIDPLNVRCELRVSLHAFAVSKKGGFVQLLRFEKAVISGGDRDIEPFTERFKAKRAVVLVGM